MITAQQKQTMQRIPSKATQILSSIIVILTIIASAGGLLLPGLYHDNLFLTANWLGSDLIDLFLVAPLLGAATVLAARGSTRAYLVWLGLLQCTLYNFAYYLFAAAFNVFFLLYVALFGLSIWTLFIGLNNLDVAELRTQFSARTPTRAIGIYMLFIGLGLTTVYVATCVVFIVSGQLPSVITRSAHPTNMVFALDLSMVVPLFVVGGIWLWQRRPWGYVLAAIGTVKGAVYLVGLCASTWTVYQAGVSDSPAEIAIWGSIAVTCLIALVALLRNLRPGTQSADVVPSRRRNTPAGASDAR